MISFFKNLKVNKLKAISYKLNAGMSYVELIVVLSIFSMISSIVVFNYGGFQAKVDIKILASDIALKIVEAQKVAISGALPMQGGYGASWKPSYGVYFNSSVAIDSDSIAFNKKFIYFADFNNSGFFDGSICTAECLEKITITKGNSISEIRVFYQDNSTPILNDLNITFTRPNSGAKIKSTEITYPLVSPINYVQIKIISPKGATAVIKLYPSGRVQVN